MNSNGFLAYNLEFYTKATRYGCNAVANTNAAKANVALTLRTD